VKDGTTTAYDWIGLLPAKDRLQKIDPENGYIVTANNKIASK
jgi:acyl-homoserine lactone acylase PvdQ